MLGRLLGPSGRNKVALAFSERFLVLARPGEAPRSLPLPRGLLEVSAVSANMKSVSEMGKLAASLVGDSEMESAASIEVVLPDLLVTALVLPEARRARRRELVERLAARLPYPASEARVDFWPGACGEVLAVAVRLAVIRQYEQVVEVLGRRCGWMDTATLVSVPTWSQKRRKASEDAIEVELDLFGSHYSIASFRGGELVDLRFKLRPPGDVAYVSGELARLPLIYEAPVARLSVRGEGAEALVSEGARLAVAHLSGEEMTEDALLGRAAAALLVRSH